MHMMNAAVKNCLKCKMQTMLRKTLVLAGLLITVAGFAGGTETGKKDGPQKPPLKTIIIDPGHGGHDGGAEFVPAY